MTTAVDEITDEQKEALNRLENLARALPTPVRQALADYIWAEWQYSLYALAQVSTTDGMLRQQGIARYLENQNSIFQAIENGLEDTTGKPVRKSRMGSIA